MKKVLSVFLAIFILCGCISAFATVSSAYTAGDLNSDGVINAVDALLMSNCIVSCSGSSASMMGDLNGDRKVNATDLGLFALYFVGKYDVGEAGWKIAKITLGETDISQVVIENTDPADECMTFAAQELRNHIGDACGIYPEIVTDRGDQIAITLLKDTTMTGDEAGVLGDEAYHVYTTDNGLTIEGGRFAGCLRGVYDFLYNYLGYRFYYKPSLEKYTEEDNAFRYVYESEGIYLYNIDETRYPAIGIRSTYGEHYFVSPAKQYNGEKYFNVAKYGVWGVTNKACHGIESYWSEAERNEGGWGYQNKKQPCFTDTKFTEETIRRVLESLDSKVAAGAVPGKNLTNVDVAQLDTAGFCECRTCKNVVAAEGSYSGTNIRFANAIDDAIQARPEYKGKIYTSILVYTDTIKVPQITRPNPTIVLSFCFYVSQGVFECAHCSIASDTCPDNAKHKALFEAWNKFGNRMFVWYYPLEAYYYGGSAIYLFNCYEDIKYLAAHHVYGVFVCGTDDPYDSSFIMQSMLQELMWNCDMTYDEYCDRIREMLWLQYGDAGQYIYEYFTMIQEAANTAGGTYGSTHYCGFHSAVTNKLNMTYIKENADTILALRSEALAAATDAQNYRDVDVLFLHSLYLVCGATHTSWYLNGTEETREKYKELLSYFVAHAKEYKCQIASGEGGFEKIYVEPTRIINWSQNPFLWCEETLGVGFGGFNHDFNY